MYTQVNSDAADTLDAFVGVLDAEGNVRNVTASGVRIHLPAIPGILTPFKARIHLMVMLGNLTTFKMVIYFLQCQVM